MSRSRFRSCSARSWRREAPTCTSRRVLRRWCASTASSSRRGSTRCSRRGHCRGWSTRSLPQKLRERFEQELELDMSYSLPGRSRFRVNVFQQRDALGAVFRVIPFEIKDVDDLGLPNVVIGSRAVPAWVRRRHRPDGLGQVDDARGDGRHREPRASRPHHDGRRPDRVPPPPQELRGQPARGRGGHARLRTGPQARAASGPGRDPGRRDAGPRDDRNGDHGGRDRPPGLRDAAHAGRAADDRPDHRRVPAPPAAAGQGPAVDHAPRRGHAAAHPHGRRAGTRRRCARSSCAPPRSAT